MKNKQPPILGNITMLMQFNIDDNLLNEAVKLGDFKTPEETLETVLREFILRKKQLEIIELFGKLDPDENYNYKQGRQ
jgi:hypothetical protein